MTRFRLSLSIYVVVMVLFCLSLSPALAKKPRTSYERLMDAVVVVRLPNSVGTGFFVTKNGLIVTNHHVVGENQTVAIELRGGKKLTGRVVGLDRKADLALVSVPVNAPHWLRLAKPGEAVVGMEVIAIGTAMGFSWSVSRGIVSGLREIGGMKVVQTDAAVNQGNSGGPLINKRTGRVVGVNTFVIRKHLAEGMNFAMAAETVREALAADKISTKKRTKASKGNQAHSRDLMKLVGMKHGQFRRDDGEVVFLVGGGIKNQHQGARSNILLKIGFADQAGKVLLEETLYGGHFFNPKAIETVDLERIHDLLTSPTTSKGKMIYVKPNQTIPFLAVVRFTPLLGKAKKWGLFLVDSSPYKTKSKKKAPQGSLVTAQLSQWSAQTTGFKAGGGGGNGGGMGSGGGKAAMANQSTDQPDELHGNTRSKVFHKAGCRHYMCRYCTEVFKNSQEATAKGYRPCRRCKP